MYLNEDVSVRAEAAVVITNSYDIDTMDATSDNFCDVMSHLILADIENELKIKALDFWHKVIDVFFRRQGIVDGQFPQATFSKQLKRIINFDQRTIRQYLQNILVDLSQVGCLAIFIHIFRKEQNVDICFATKICYQELIDLIKQHRITVSDTSASDSFNSVSTSISSSTDFSSPPLSPVSFISDFESIDVQELGVLDNSVLESYFAVTDDCVLKGRQVVSPNEFLRFIYNEFDSCFAKIRKKADNENNVDRFLEKILSADQ